MREDAIHGSLQTLYHARGEKLKTTILKTGVLKLLRNADAHVSGQEICEKFGVSRTAVWKVINSLKEEGYDIEAVQNKGYRITSYPDLVSESELESRLDTAWAGKKIFYYESIESTNTQGKRLAEAGEGHGTLVIADMQESGRGRRGREWISPPGTGIWMTLILKPSLHPRSASMLTLVMAVSVAKACREVTGLEAMIKWPNDIVVNGRKVCGILTEMSAEMDCINHIVIGTGINVNMEQFPEEISSIATSLRIEASGPVSRGMLIERVLKNFESDYQLFIAKEDLSGLVEEYNNMLINKEKEIKVLEPGNEYTGTTHGINERGELVVEKPDGSIENVFAGEVSVRGLYGYV